MNLLSLFQENQELMLTYGTIIFIGLIVLFLLLSIRLYLVERRLNSLLKGAQGDNLDVILRQAVESSQELESHLDELYDLIEKQQNAASESLQNVGLIRFNAFPGQGGDLSFAMALLNNQGNGVVLTNLAGRDNSRIFAKNIVRGKSPYLLSEEEKSSISKALENIQNS